MTDALPCHPVGSPIAKFGRRQGIALLFERAN